MKTYNALTKYFTDEVQTKIVEGELSLDDIFNKIKYDIKITYKDGEHNGYYYVDLGLPSGTMWATFNVGSNNIIDNGLLFQWGRVDGYRYDDKNNKFITPEQNKQYTGNEYIPVTTSGTTYDESNTLNLEDDAANANMGGYWRMPTKDELQELLDNTTYDVITVNGVKGMLFTSNINGHKLFIPFSGYFGDSNFRWLGYNANIWSSSVHETYTNDAYSLYFNDDNNILIFSYYRSYGFSVRGVYKKIN